MIKKKKKKKDLKKSRIKAVFLGVRIFSSLVIRTPCFPKPTQIRTSFGFVNPYELLDAPEVIFMAKDITNIPN